jgi:hypothetical protein
MPQPQIITFLIITALTFLPVTQVFAADEGDWKKGRIYYRMTCTACHKAMTGQGISPASMTIEEWKQYIAADKHDASGKSNASVKYYVSREYRESVKDSNKAAAKYIDMTDEELLANVRAFVIHGAKDSDTPARCQ